MRFEGQTIILNGAPRSGKSSIVEVVQDTFDGVWMNLGVHITGIYDLEVDTTMLGPEACAAVIRRHLDHGPPPSAFRQLAAMTTGSSFLTGSFSSAARWTPAGASAILADSPSPGSV